MKTMALLLPALVSVAGVVLAYLCQDRFIYGPRPYPEERIRDFVKRGGTVLRFVTEAGPQTAFYVPPDGEGRAGEDLPETVWCCFAGVSGLALSWETYVRGLRGAETGFLLVEWPGYGASSGRPRPHTIRAAVRGAVRALAEHHGRSEAAFRGRISALGHSLGAAGALAAAEEVGAEQIILFAPFTSLREMAVLRVGPVLAPFVNHDYDNRAVLGRLADQPRPPRVLILHGTADEVIPIRMARDLRDRNPEAVTLVELPGADHNNLFGPAKPWVQEALAERSPAAAAATEREPVLSARE
jgi:pimeloyl-ACP methyl ester carboxylesterase